MAKEPKDIAQFKLRMRESLRARLDEEAARNAQSINSEIVSRLERSLSGDDNKGGGVQAQFLGDLLAVMNRVSRDIGSDWYADLEAWNIVRSVALYMLEEIKPDPREMPKLPDDPATLAILARYQDEHAKWSERQHVLGRRHAELWMKREAHGLTDDEEREYAEVDAEARANREPPQPALPDNVLPVWQAHMARAAAIKRATDGAVAVMPTPKPGR